MSMGTAEDNSSSAGEDHADRAAFGFDLSHDAWARRLRALGAAPPHGRIGEYEIIDTLGRGGQGIVYRVRQPRTGRDIALKRLAAGEFATPSMAARFEREVAAAAALQHPNIVTVFGSERIGEQVVLTMQWIDGAPFDQWARHQADSATLESNIKAAAFNDDGKLKALPRDPREIILSFIRVCDAIHHAHQRGIIHRDLKPSNILVTGDGQPHVVDFGLAKLASGAETHTVLTQTGALLGTPAYAAPELILNSAAEADVRADIYSLGAVLYQAVTGRLPFPAEPDLQKLLNRIQNDEPPAPVSIVRTISPDLDAIIRKAMSKEKDRRYASVDALRSDLQAFLVGAAVSAHPPSAGYRARKFIARNRGVVIVSLLFAAILLVSAVLSTSLYFRAEEQRRRADAALLAEKEQLRQAREFMEQTAIHSARARASDYLMTELLDRTREGTQSGAAGPTLETLLGAISSQLTNGHVQLEEKIEAHAQRQLGSAYLYLGLVDRARLHLERAVAIWSASSTPLDYTVRVDQAEAMEHLGRYYRRKGRLADAERMMEGALGLRRETIKDKYDGFFAVNYNSLGILKRQQGKYEEAKRLFLDSIDVYEHCPDIRDANIPLVLQNLAIVYQLTGEVQDAERVAREALSRTIGFHDESHPDIASVELTLAGIIDQTGGHQESFSLYQDAIAILREKFGDHHPRLGVAYGRIARWYESEGDSHIADLYIGQSIDIFTASGLWDEAINNIRARANLHRANGEYLAAKRYLCEAVQSGLEQLPANHPLLISSIADYASLLMEVGEFALARNSLEQAKQQILAASGDWPETLDALLPRAKQFPALKP